VEAGLCRVPENWRWSSHSMVLSGAAPDWIDIGHLLEYFGTADGYLAYLTRFLKPGGQLGVATPALRTEIRDLGYIPDHIKKLVGWEALAWHTADWWRFHWEITELVEVTAARLQESGWHDWLTWARAVSDHRGSRDASLDMLEADQGEYLTFALLAARKAAA
jgi:predicted SAM-dependent methyltransferase